MVIGVGLAWAAGSATASVKLCIRKRCRRRPRSSAVRTVASHHGIRHRECGDSLQGSDSRRRAGPWMTRAFPSPLSLPSRQFPRDRSSALPTRHVLIERRARVDRQRLADFDKLH